MRANVAGDLGRALVRGGLDVRGAHLPGHVHRLLLEELGGARVQQRLAGLRLGAEEGLRGGAPHVGRLPAQREALRVPVELHRGFLCHAI